MSDHDGLERIINGLQIQGVTLVEAVDRFERGYLLTALRRSHGNQSAAAKALGIHRNTLAKHLRKLGPIL